MSGSDRRRALRGITPELLAECCGEAVLREAVWLRHQRVARRSIEMAEQAGLTFELVEAWRPRFTLVLNGLSYVLPRGTKAEELGPAVVAMCKLLCRPPIGELDTVEVVEHMARTFAPEVDS